MSKLQDAGLKCKLDKCMFAQPELDETLSKHNLRQLRQRITFSQNIENLNKSHVRQYIYHRLAVAGYNGKPIFNEGAINALYEYSKGIPRLLSILSGKSLLIAFSKGSRTVTKAMIRRAAQDTESIEYKPKWFFGWV